MEMSNEDENNEVDVRFEKIDDEEDEDIEEEEQEAPEELHVVEERVVNIVPTSVIEEDADAENEDTLADTNDDVLEQQLKGQSIQIEKLAEQLQTLQMRYDESKDQFERINGLESQLKKLKMQISEIINKKTSKSKNRKIKNKKVSSSTKKRSKRNKKQRI
jgi:hypothetical protein